MPNIGYCLTSNRIMTGTIIGFFATLFSFVFSLEELSAYLYGLYYNLITGAQNSVTPTWSQVLIKNVLLCDVCCLNCGRKGEV